MGLSHTDWQFVPTVLNDLSDLSLSFLLKVHFATTVDFSNNLFNLFLNRKVIVIQTFIVRWFSAIVLTTVSASATPPSAPSAQTPANSTGTSIESQSSSRLQFQLLYQIQIVNNNNRWNTELTDIFNVAFQLAKPARTAPYFPLSKRL